jgi:hypothetical protein
MTYRGLDRNFNEHPYSEFRPTGKRIAIRTATCHEYVFTTAKDVRYTMWLDPVRDYTIRRFSHEYHQTITQFDADYRQDKQWRWVPTSWVRTYHSPRSAYTSRGTVVAMRFNQPQPEEQFFQMSFPPGTWVQDLRTDPPANYRVKPDGSIRPLPQSGEEIPDPVPQPDPNWFEENRSLLLLAAVLLIGFAGWRVGRRFGNAVKR